MKKVVLSLLGLFLIGVSYFLLLMTARMEAFRQTVDEKFMKKQERLFGILKQRKR